MPIPQTPRRRPSNSPPLFSSSGIRSNTPRGDESLAQRITRLAQRALSNFTRFISRGGRRLSSWFFSFLRTWRDKNSQSGHSLSHSQSSAQLARRIIIDRDLISDDERLNLQEQEASDSLALAEDIDRFTTHHFRPSTPEPSQSSPIIGSNSNRGLIPKTHLENTTSDQDVSDPRVSSFENNEPYALARGSAATHLQNGSTPVQSPSHLEQFQGNFPEEFQRVINNNQGHFQDLKSYLREIFLQLPDFELFRFELKRGGGRTRHLNRCLSDHQSGGADNERFTALIFGEIRNALRDRSDAANVLFQKAAFLLFTGLRVMPFAENRLQLHRMNLEQIDLDSLASTIEHLLNQMATSPILFFDRLKTRLRKKEAKLNGKDANSHNVPLTLGMRTFQMAGDSTLSHYCHQLHHPTPTLESGNCTIAPEYEAFIDCADQMYKNILYSNHQSEHQTAASPLADEANRVALFKEFERSKENFFLISLPVLDDIDDPAICDKSSLCACLESFFSDLDLGKSKGFYFSENAKRGLHGAIVEGQRHISPEFISQRAAGWSSFIKDYLMRESEVHDPTARSMYLTLLQSLIRNDIIVHCNMHFCNNTCKDAIDQGAVHTFVDILWTMMLNERENSPSDLKNLIASTIYPAFAVKRQAILPHRRAIITQFARKIGSLTPLQKAQIRAGALAAGQKVRTQFFFDSDFKLFQGAMPYPTASDATIENKWDELLNTSRDLIRSQPGSVRLMGQDLKSLYLQSGVPDSVYSRSNRVVKEFYDVFGAMQEQGGALEHVSDERFESRIASLAHLMTQATSSLATSVAKIYAQTHFPFFEMAAGSKCTTQMSWSLSLDDTPSSSHDHSLTSSQIMFKAIFPFIIFDKDRIGERDDLGNNIDEFHLRAKKGELISQLTSSIDLHQFFSSDEEPALEFRFSVESASGSNSNAN